jgi:hypothetical protein
MPARQQLKRQGPVQDKGQESPVRSVIQQVSRPSIDGSINKYTQHPANRYADYWFQLEWRSADPGKFHACVNKPGCDEQCQSRAGAGSRQPTIIWHPNSEELPNVKRWVDEKKRMAFSGG